MKLLVLLCLVINLFVQAQNPYMTGALINSCNGSCSEGDNELIFGNTGVHSVVANSTNIQVFYGSAANPVTDYTSPLVSNSATTASLNSAAGCSPNVFMEGTGVTMPPNSSFLIVRNTLCVSALTWSTLCGTGPIYILYSTDPSWLAAGNFSNGTGSTRFFKTIIRNTTGTSFTTQYDYTLPAAFGNDGAFATWNSTGGSPTSYGDNDCSINPVILPVELVDYKGQIENDKVILNWTTSSETRTESFSIQRAGSELNFKTIATIESRGTSSTGFSYQFEDLNPVFGMNYYKLLSKDIDQTVKEIGLIVVDHQSKEAYYNSQLNELILPQLGVYQLFSMDGRMVSQFGDEFNQPMKEHGLFLLVNLRNNQQQRIFIP